MFLHTILCTGLRGLSCLLSSSRTTVDPVLAVQISWMLKTVLAVSLDQLVQEDRLVSQSHQHSTLLFHLPIISSSQWVALHFVYRLRMWRTCDIHQEYLKRERKNEDFSIYRPLRLWQSLYVHLSILSSPVAQSPLFWLNVRMGNENWFNGPMQKSMIVSLIETAANSWRSPESTITLWKGGERQDQNT